MIQTLRHFNLFRKKTSVEFIHHWKGAEFLKWTKLECGSERFE